MRTGLLTCAVPAYDAIDYRDVSGTNLALLECTLAVLDVNILHVVRMDDPPNQ